MPLTRRRFLELSAASLAAASAAPSDGAEPAAREITCFYQFGKGALDALSAVLPNGPGHLHVFSHSHPGMRPHPETAKAVRAAGSSFRYALAFDVHKYPGWHQAPDEQLKAWATEFRTQALDPTGPADYFAFNEMPTTGAATPHLREQAAKLLRFLHTSGEGPALPGVFYFTERNLNPANWQGEGDDFWAALHETCELVVGEHYHSYEFIFSKTPAALADHLFALPKWLKGSGKAPQIAIADRKYAVLHSSYYGTAMTGWAGVDSAKHPLDELEHYFERVLEATRLSEFGRSRAAFGPLAARDLEVRLFPILAEALGKALGG